MTNFRWRDLMFTVPAALLLGAALAAIGPGRFLSGWAGFTALLLVGGMLLSTAVRWGGNGRVLAWMSLLAFGLRLLVGTTLSVVLPMDGYEEPDDQAGFVFTDAHRRDDQAWELASSGASLISAFDREYYTDQYGGLLALSALTYRLFSSEAHRPLLILTLAALTAAIGVPFFWRATNKLWGAKVAVLAGWLYSLYPESVLTGGAQMREPFLLTFIAFSMWGFAGWLERRSPTHTIWLLVGLGGLILISPAIALVLVVLLTVWLRIHGEHGRVPAYIWLGASVLFVAAFVFLAWSLGSRGPGGSGPFGIIAAWFRDAVEWVVYQLERGSGQVQNVFSKLFPGAQLAFVVAYGVTQPLLPPAILEPTTITWHVVGILRALGWYILLPLLVYAPFAVVKMKPSAERRVWGWLSSFSWLWILFCSIRAGGDQWDNPRYRLIFFGIQAMVAAMAWTSWRDERDPWLARILAAEGLCLLLFGQWYLARYYLIGIHLPIMVVMGLCILVVLSILAGGVIWDRRARRETSQGSGQA